VDGAGRVRTNLWSDMTGQRTGSAAKTRPSPRAYATAANIATAVIVFGGQCSPSQFAARGTPCTDTTWEYHWVYESWRPMNSELVRDSTPVPPPAFQPSLRPCP
jgi:hypothetical protein